MKKRKIILVTLAAVLFTSSLAGCGKSEKADQQNKQAQEAAAEAEPNHEAEKYFESIEVSNTIEEINGIIGFEAEKNEYKEEYKWKFEDETSIVANMTAGDMTLGLNFKKEAYANDKVDLSCYYDIEEALESGTSFTYEEIVEKVGGEAGILAGKTSTSKRYSWVDKHHVVFSATFSDNLEGRCSIISMR